MKRLDRLSEGTIVRQLEEKIKRNEAELLRYRQIASLGMMASGLAHEINQPLQIILGRAQNCMRDVERKVIDTDGILADLKYIATTTKRIDRIVNHLYVLSREHKPKLEAIDVNLVIENSFIMFNEQLKSRRIYIKKNLENNLPRVRADIIQLEQVFINLITNARDALEGQQNKKIIISNNVRNDKIQIMFVDNGRGISK